MATKSRKRSVVAENQAAEPETRPARKNRPRLNRLAPGVHVAPFLSLRGDPVLIDISWDGTLWGTAEVTRVANATFLEFQYHGGDELWMPRPVDEAHWAFRQRKLLPRGVHRAPFVIGASMRYHAPQASAFLAIDGAHRLVAMLAVAPPAEREPPTEQAEAEAMRTLTAVLEAHEAREADATEAAIAAGDPVPDFAGTHTFKPDRSGVWTRQGRDYLFVDSKLRHAATLRLADWVPKEIDALRLSATVRRLMRTVDPARDDDDDDDGDEAWKH